MDISGIALQGLEQAYGQLNQAASNIANASTTASNGSVNVANLGQDMVSLMSAQNLFEANIDSLKTADQIQKNLLDVTA